MSTWNHYALCDPNEPDLMRSIRYIGRTTRKIGQRAYDHKDVARESGKKSRTRLCQWMRELLGAGQEPIVLDLGASADPEQEPRWIRQFRERGADLLNGTEGHEGKVFTDEARAAMSAGMKEWWRANREQLEAAGSKRRTSRNLTESLRRARRTRERRATLLADVLFDPSKAVDQNIVRLHEAGAAAQQIASLLGMPYVAVRKLLMERGEWRKGL